MIRPTSGQRNVQDTVVRHSAQFVHQVSKLSACELRPTNPTILTRIHMVFPRRDPTPDHLKRHADPRTFCCPPVPSPRQHRRVFGEQSHPLIFSATSLGASSQTWRPSHAECSAIVFSGHTLHWLQGSNRSTMHISSHLVTSPDQDHENISYTIFSDFHLKSLDRSLATVPKMPFKPGSFAFLRHHMSISLGSYQRPNWNVGCL